MTAVHHHRIVYIEGETTLSQLAGPFISYNNSNGLYVSAAPSDWDRHHHRPRGHSLIGPIELRPDINSL